MSDQTVTAMVSPNPINSTIVTRDATAYRTDTDGLVYVFPQHIAEMQGYGYTLAVASQVPAGDPLVDDLGWPVAQ